MLRFGLFLALVAISAAEDHAAEEAKVAFLNIKGLLIPDRTGGAATRTFAFRTEGEDVTEVDVITFKCGPINNVYAADDTSRKPVILCEGEVPNSVQGLNNKLVFLFSAEGLELAPEEREINLLLGRNAVSHLQVVTGKVIDEELVRAKRQFGFGGSGAQAGASSFGGGFGGGGFPGGFGGGFSGSQAGAGAGSFGGGFGR